MAANLKQENDNDDDEDVDIEMKSNPNPIKGLKTRPNTLIEDNYTRYYSVNKETHQDCYVDKHFNGYYLFFFVTYQAHYFFLFINYLTECMSLD